MLNMTADQIMFLVGGILILVGAYNTVMTAKKNKREDQEVKDKPISDLQQKVTKLEGDFNLLELKVTRVEDNSKDLYAGIMAICEGVQAQLNNSMNGGNENEMREATTSINKWLHTRQTMKN